MTGVAADWACLVVLRGAKDARSARTPQKCRHVVMALQGLDLRMSTLLGVDMRRPKAFSGDKLRMSTLFVASATLHGRTKNPRPFVGIVTDKPRMRIWGAIRRRSIVSWLCNQGSPASSFQRVGLREGVPHDRNGNGKAHGGTSNRAG